MKPFEIFRTGRQTPMKGDPIDFGDGELVAIAAGYDPAKHHAPIVVGHPKTDAPAYGWIDGLECRDGRLVATPADVEPAFGELVSSKRYPKVSASFYRPNSPSNPTPGAYYLRHVGFLGAQPPSVKGLKPIEFASAEDELTIEFASDWTLSSVASSSSRMFRRIRDWFVQERGVEVADDLLPEWEIDSLTRASITAEPEPPRFAEPNPERNSMDPKLKRPDPAELERREAALTASEAAFAERQAQARAGEDGAFVASIVAEGRLPKTLQATAVALFAELDEDVLEFGEGEEAESTTPRAAFRDLLARIPLPVATGELAKGDDDLPSFADPAETAGHIRTEMAAAADKGEEISSAQALDRLKKRVAK